MSKFPMLETPDIDSYLWLEDSSQTGVEQGQYKVTLESVYAPLVPIFTYAAYGGLTMTAPQSGFWNDIGITWQKLDVFDAQSVTTQKGVTSDVPNDTFAIDLPGVYWYSLNLSFEHNSSNQGRLTYVRFYDTVAPGVMGPSMVIATGRNAEATAYSVSALFEVPAGEEGRPIQIEIGGGDSYSLVSFDVAQISIMGAGEYQGGDLSAP